MSEHISHESTRSPKSTHASTPFEIRNVRDARNLFAAFIKDERDLNRAATIFIKLGNAVAGRDAGTAERANTLQSFYERVALDPATNKERPNVEKAVALRHTLAEMRELNFVAQSSQEAHRAHMEIDSYNSASDDLRALFEVPENHTRAEHASYLNTVNQGARDLFEHGASVYGETLVVPREANGTPDRANQIRLGSLTHAAREFAPLIGDEQAKVKAAEFVELGRQIAGRTADGDTRLVTFRAFYQDIKRDEHGRVRTRDEQAAQIAPVLERMRVLAAAMREQEWRVEPHEFVSLEDWERGLEARQRDTEHETYGRLTFRLDEILNVDSDDEREERERVESRKREDEYAIIGGASSQIEYERISLNHLPPRLPERLTTEDEERLRYEVIPRLDRLIESGVRPQEIMRGLSVQAERETRRGREQEVARLLLERAPAANREHSLTRDEEARALYTLRALGVVSTEEIEQRGLTARERAASIDIVGVRLAQDYRDEIAELKTFTELDSERERLHLEAAQFRESQHTSPEFQLWFAVLHTQERDNHLSELEALTRGNNARLTFSSKAQSGRSNYPELIGEPRPLSLYAKRQGENENAHREVRRQLESLLISPDIERAQSENAARIEVMTQRYSRITGRDITSAHEAQDNRAPHLRQTRAILDGLAQERATLKIEKVRSGERHANHLYVSLASNNSIRLPVENINEYRTLIGIAGQMQTGVSVYAGRHGREITGYDVTREQELNFARDYVAYRQLDDTTRLLNSHRLFREFNARLGSARDAGELRETIKEIRQENYARGRFPERYRAEADILIQRSEQPRRSLTEPELQKLFLSPAPTHYTTEMRDVRLNSIVSARDKAERIKGLANGTLTPSPMLSLLLTEFERTKSDNPTQYARNIKSFLTDYLNPPAPNRNRFSAHNLYDLRQQLAPAERDYLFKVVDGTKQAVTSGDSVRQVEQIRNQAHDFDQVAHSEKGRAQAIDLLLQRGTEINNLREELEDKVSAYLLTMVERRSVQSFESSNESLHHAAQVTQIIKDTLAENSHVLKSIRPTNEHIAHIAGKLIGELPYALREGRDRIIGQDHTHALAERSELVLIAGNTRLDTDKDYEREVVARMTREAMRPAIVPVNARSLDDEVVEQKISHGFEQTAGTVLTQASNPAVASLHLAHQPRAHDLAANPKEEHVRQRTLSR